MAKHDVKFSPPERDLGKADIEFAIKQDGIRFGTLRVSKGTIVWIPKKGGYGYRLGWTGFDEVMKQQTGFEKR